MGTENKDEAFDKQLNQLTKIKTLEMLSNSVPDNQLLPLIIQQNTRLMELLTDLTSKIIMNYTTKH